MWAQRLLLVLSVFHNYLIIRGECPADRKRNIENFEEDLQEDLFCDYNNNYRPVQDHNSTVKVEVSMAITYITFDETEEVFTVHCRLGLKWRDEFLKWDPNNYGGVKEIQVESHKIWVPRLALFNSDSTAYQSDGIYTTCLLQSNGTVLCAPHDSRSGLCRTWLREWPYDRQNCTLYFGSWVHKGEQINFTFPANGGIVYESFDDGPGWKLLDVTNVWLPGIYSCCPNESYPMLKYIFQLEREAKGLEAIIVIPSIVLLVLTTTSLLLDVKEDTRLALQCFALFGHFMYLDVVVYHLPKQNLDTPSILLFIRDSMVVSLASIVLTLILAPLRERSEAPAPWLAKLNRLITSGPGKYVVFTGFEPTDVSDRSNLTEQDTDDIQSSDASAWLTLANAINSIVFIIFVIVYITLLCIYIPSSDRFRM